VNAATETTNKILRSTFTSVIVSALSAVALALAFPKAGQAWLAPLAAAGLFWAWQRLSWKRAFFAGWFAGTIFFTINFSWFTYTVGAYVGAFAFAVVLIPALVEGLTFALSAVAARAADRFAPAWAAPAAAAAAFTVFEWLRSIGLLAVPFAQIGYSQTVTPLIAFAPYIGAFGVTFVVMLLGAYAAQALASRNPRTLAIVVVVVAGAWAACFAAWPARYDRRVPELRVGAVQGNIAQTVKWNPQAFWPTVNTYLAQSRKLQPLHPQLVVLPETVIPTDLNANDPNGVRALVRSEFSALARSLNTTLVVGSLEARGPKDYNALFVFNPAGQISQIYEKRQLVPFTESFPGEAFLQWLPDADLIGRFAAGNDDAVISAGGVPFAPLICWESAFADLVHAQVSRGAQFLVIATDDAWFGETSGTYQHAQIAQMRAIENGEWVLQSAATGISGIIAPDGSWTQRTALDKPAIVTGMIGSPSGSMFARIGPTPVVVTLALMYAAILAFRSLRARIPRWRAPQWRPTMARWKLYLLLAGAAVLIWVIAGVVLAGNEPGTPPQGLTPLTLHGGRVTGNRMSTKSWMFEYEHAEMSADGVLATVQGVRRGVLYKNGKPYLSVRAEQVSVNTQSFDFTATGDVHVTQMQDTSSERSFDTDLITWINATKTLTLPHPSVVRSGGQTLRVSSINVNFTTGQIRFGGVSGGVAP
jgi:apolipoprotein N-acyltransferase